MIVYIEIDGCDDTTAFSLPYSEELVSYLMMISDKSFEHSSYGCQPRLHFYVFNKEDKFDFSIDDDIAMWEYKKQALYHYYKGQKIYNF